MSTGLTRQTRRLSRWETVLWRFIAFCRFSSSMRSFFLRWFLPADVFNRVRRLLGEEEPTPITRKSYLPPPLPPPHLFSRRHLSSTGLQNKGFHWKRPPASKARLRCGCTFGRCEYCCWRFFPSERHLDGGKSRCADPPALREKSVIKHKAPLNFLKWKTEAAPTVTWCADADFCWLSLSSFNFISLGCWSSFYIYEIINWIWIVAENPYKPDLSWRVTDSNCLQSWWFVLLGTAVPFVSVDSFQLICVFIKTVTTYGSVGSGQHWHWSELKKFLLHEFMILIFHLFRLRNISRFRHGTNIFGLIRRKFLGYWMGHVIFLWRLPAPSWLDVTRETFGFQAAAFIVSMCLSIEFRQRESAKGGFKK